jgi:hypothetical protein
MSPVSRRCRWSLCLLGVVAFALAAPAGEGAPPEPQRVDAAVRGGLRWLAANQISEGPEAGRWDGRSYETAVASLAGLAFLANGHLPGTAEHGEVVTRAMRFVQATQTPEGYLGTRGDSMYVHAMCSLFGLSYLGMAADSAHDAELAEWCRRSIDVIIKAQAVRKSRWARGGWRYTPHDHRSDLSITSWQLLVLHAARQCGYDIDDGIFDDALAYIDRGFLELQNGAGAFYYRPGTSKDPEPGVTGAALFIKSIAQQEPDTRFRSGYRYLVQYPPRWGGAHHSGYFYFTTWYLVLGMFQIGEDAWPEMSQQIATVLLNHQQGDGDWGFPADAKRESREAGTAYATAMSVLMLSLDKQYLPMYQQQKRLF